MDWPNSDPSSRPFFFCRSEAELFSKLESAKSRSKAGEKLPAAEMKEPWETGIIGMTGTSNGSGDVKKQQRYRSG